MKNLKVLALLFFAGFAQAQSFNNATFVQQFDPTGSYFVNKVLWEPPSDGLYFYSYSLKNPSFVTLGTGLSVSSGVLGVTFPSQVNADWSAVSGVAQILNKPSIGAFTYSDPTTRTLSASTSYQASDNTKAAVITISPQCQNVTSLVAASACTMQVRQHTSAVTCSTGTVVSTWTSQVNLGLVFTQTFGSPVDIKLGIGRFFILCPTAGTFTITTAVDQSAG